MMAELTPIERYREGWEPDKELIASLETLVAKAEASSNFAAALFYQGLLLDAWTPPLNLPLKNLTVTDCHSN